MKYHETKTLLGFKYIVVAFIVVEVKFDVVYGHWSSLLVVFLEKVVAVADILVPPFVKEKRMLITFV